MTNRTRGGGVDRDAVTIRLNREIKAAAQRHAQAQNRSFVGYLEWLVIEAEKAVAAETKAHDRTIPPPPDWCL